MIFDYPLFDMFVVYAHSINIDKALTYNEMNNRVCIENDFYCYEHVKRVTIYFFKQQILVIVIDLLT